MDLNYTAVNHRIIVDLHQNVPLSNNNVVIVLNAISAWSIVIADIRSILIDEW